MRSRMRIREGSGVLLARTEAVTCLCSLLTYYIPCIYGEVVSKHRDSPPGIPSTYTHSSHSKVLQDVLRIMWTMLW